ncbi:MAG: glutamate racemase [Candidatus Curtissbacteria bacterium]|nr:glutamate racemase [Candidatus Curtissbacteria bacterium]
MQDKRPIGLFDSGVGGLSVLLEIAKILPNENFIFLADQLNVPYGGKTKRELEDLTERITYFLMKKKIKALVVACNTATCYALDYLRFNFDIPIVGVVPAVKPSAKLTKTGKIAIMSTPATAKSAYLASLIVEFGKHKNFLKLGCDGLEDAVETLDTNALEKLLDKYCAQIKKFGADVVILGCTHFPFLKEDIKKRLGPNVKVIDSGQAIARRVKYLLKRKDILSSSKDSDLFFTTGDEKEFSRVASQLLESIIKSQKAEI